jgi:membrane fusion protein (multidrug efflux system)
MSMANSLELRVPFLDKEVWNLARTIPSKFKVTKDGQTKVAMRKAALKNMPEIDLRLNDKSIYNQKGKIETISGVIDPATGTVSLRAIFPNKDGLLHSGGAGSVMLPITYKDVVVIPRNTTFELQHMTFVYKVVNGVTVANPIQAMRVDGGKECIVEMGLYPGDTIVAEGVALLREGTPIKPKQAPVAEQPAK